MIDNFFAGSKGLTLPVWVAAAARTATEILLGGRFVSNQSILIPDQEHSILVPVTSAALLAGGRQALAISHCESQLGLDITRGLEIWVLVQWDEQQGKFFTQSDAVVSEPWLNIVAGEGVGKFEANGKICLSDFALELIHSNLRSLVPKDRCLMLEVVFPVGKQLASRTSNQAFGIVDGLAIIGTQAEAQVSASPEQLKNTLDELHKQCEKQNFSGFLTLVIGENGFNLACSFGLDSEPLIKSGNWLGPLIVASAKEGVKELLVFGYHGKLIKLAGGIFHTHNHLADARIEVLTALAVKEGLSLELISSLSKQVSVEAAFQALQTHDEELAHKLWYRLALEIEQRSAAYVSRYFSSDIEIGAAVFDRSRRVRWAGPNGIRQLAKFGLSPDGGSTLL